MALYAVQSELIADYLPEVTSAAELAALVRILAAVTAQIDSYCDRPVQYFAPASSTASARIFRGNNKHYLQIPVHNGLVSTVTGSELGQAVTVESWEETGGWLYRVFPNDGPFRIWRGDIDYTVTAKWGYAATPLDVAEACRQLVVHYFERQKGTIGQVTPNGFVIERDMPPSVKTLLEPYVRKEFEVT